jgi:carboxypeptidase family protein
VLRRFLRYLLSALLACASPMCAQIALRPAQVQNAARAEKLAETGDNLPDAPSTADSNQSQESGSASVSGTVLDTSGAAISGAEITLTENRRSQVRSTSTGTDGSFVFSSLPPGSYTIIANANGFQQSASPEFTLTQDQAFQLPTLVLSVLTRMRRRAGKGSPIRCSERSDKRQWLESRL